MERIETLLLEIGRKQDALHEQQGEILTEIAVIRERQAQKQKDIDRAFDGIDEIKTEQKAQGRSIHALERAEALNERIRTGIWAGIGVLCLAAIGIVSMAWDSYQIRHEEVVKNEAR